MMDNLNGFQKLVSTRRTFSISMSIGLDCRDPQPYIYYMMLKWFSYVLWEHKLLSRSQKLRLNFLPVKLFEVRQQSDDPVCGGEIDGWDLFEDRQVFAAADDHEGRHVGRVSRIHLDP
jgi:hypothetical protein